MKEKTVEVSERAINVIRTASKYLQDNAPTEQYKNILNALGGVELLHDRGEYLTEFGSREYKRITTRLENLLNQANANH